MNIKMKKVTIVAERLLKEQVLDLLKRVGSTGYTLIACEGEGSRGIHASDWEGRNIQVDTIVNVEVADRLLDEVCRIFTDHYAVIAYSMDVEVRRQSKFSPEK